MTIIRESYMEEYEISSSDSERVEFPFEFAAIGAGTIHCFDIDPSLPTTDENHEVEIPHSDFTVEAATGGLLYGGKVTLAEPMTVGHHLHIRRVTPKTQDKVFRNQRAIPPEQVEEGLDKLTLIAQEEQGSQNEEVLADLDQVKQNVAALQNNKADREYVDNADALLNNRVDTLTVAVDNKVTEAPADGKTYGRKDGGWEQVTDGLPESGNVGDVLTKATPISWLAETISSFTARLVKASASVFGVVKVDGTTIVSSGGVITAVGGGSGGGGTSDHAALTNRDLADQHPDSAISRGIDADGNPAPLDQYLDGIDADITELDQDVTNLETALPAKANRTDVDTALAAKAPIASPVFTGQPSAPPLSESSPSGQLVTKGDLDAAIKAAGGLPVGSIFPWAFSTPPPGSVKLDGTLVSRTLYPSLWTLASPDAITDGEWLNLAATQSSVGQFSSGDGSTTFRLPKIVDYIRGMEAGGMIGEWLGDAIRNIKGGPHSLIAETSNAQSNFSPFIQTSYLVNMSYNNVTNNGWKMSSIGFDASTTGIPTTDPITGENRPKTIRYPYYIKAFDAATNQGLIDLTELANEVADKFDKTSAADLDKIAWAAMPSGRRVQITVPASGGTYNPPANGYIILGGNATAIGQYLSVTLVGIWGSLATSGSPTEGISTILPVSAGDQIRFDYTVPAPYAYFIYANGATDGVIYPEPEIVTGNYSLGEQWTGRLSVDGDRIYWKTIKFTAGLPAGSFTTFPHGIANARDFIKVECFMKNSPSDQYSFSVPFIGPEEQTGIRCWPGGIDLLSKSGKGATSVWNVTMYYTCTNR